MNSETKSKSVQMKIKPLFLSPNYNPFVVDDDSDPFEKEDDVSEEPKSAEIRRFDSRKYSLWINILSL